MLQEVKTAGTHCLAMKKAVGAVMTAAAFAAIGADGASGAGQPRIEDPAFKSEGSLVCGPAPAPSSKFAGPMPSAISSNGFAGLARLDAGAGTPALLVKADEARRPIGIPEDISGLAMGKDGSFWAVCDSRGELCRLAVDIDPDDGKIRKCSLSDTRHVSGGKDMEGIAYDPLRHSLWISDENGPRIYEYSFREGRVCGEIALPEYLENCIRNRSLEALEITPDGLALLVCNENAIPGDRIPGVENVAPVRLSRFTRNGANAPWRLSAQCYYLPEPPSGGVHNSKCRNGVASVCADSKGRIFVLERESDKTSGLRFRLRIFELAFPVPAGPGPSGSMPVSEKRLVYEEDTGSSMYEGMCLGPVLKNGSQTFVLVSDGDNKAIESIMTLVLPNQGK